MEEIVFNKVTDADLEKYTQNVNVFNMTDYAIKKEKILLTSFEDEHFGSSKETLDVAIYNNGKWQWLDIADKIEGYNEIPVGFLLGDLEYTRVLILVRRISSMVLDKTRDGYSAYVLCKIGKDFENVDIGNDSALLGLLAKGHVYLDEDIESVKKQIQINIVDRNEEICSRLFR